MKHAKNKESVKMQQAKSRYPMKQLVMLVIVFLAGGVIGASLTIKIIHLRIKHFSKHPEILRDRIIIRLQKELSLNKEQSEQVHKIIERRFVEIMKIRNEFNLMEKEIATVLNAEQAKKWSKLVDELRQKHFLPQSQKIQGKK